MLNDAEKEQIRTLYASNQILPETLKIRFLAHIDEGHEAVLGDGDDQSNFLCCDLTDQLGELDPTRYRWLTFDSCNALGGKAASNDMCPDRPNPG